MHINNNDLKNFQNETMNTTEMIAFLEHLEQCDSCLEQLIAEQTTQTTNIAPVYMKEAIMKRTSDPDIQIRKATVETTCKMRLFYEGLRTAAGVALALIMLFCLGQADFFSSQIPRPPIQNAAVRQDTQNSFHSFSNNIADGLSDGSQKIVDCINSISNTISKGGH